MKRTILKAFTMLWLFGMFVVLMATFLAAFQSPTKTVTISIDTYNEANFELAMMTAALFIVTVGTIFVLADIKNDYNIRLLRRLGFNQAT